MTTTAAPTMTAATAPHDSARGERTAVWLMALIAVMLGLHLQLALTRSINWDEFYFLSQVHAYARGELTLPLQTLHVQLFQWLADSDLPAVDQIVRGRLVMFVAMLGTSAAIVVTALRFTNLAGALVCALAYLTFGFVVQHGAAFRTDPLAAMLSMSALAVLARSKLSPLAILAAAAALGLAIMVTIKMVLYAPAFAGIAWLRWSESGRSAATALRISAIPVIALAIAGALYVWHAGTLASADTGAAMVSNSGATMFGLSPNLVFVANAVLMAIPFVLLLAVLVSTLIKGDGMDRATRIAVVGLAAPLLWLLIYTNTYPYFYAFILPPVCVALAAAMPAVSARWGLLPAALLLAGNGAMIWAVDGPSTQDQQRSVEQAVNTMFPQPTAYFDFPGFLPRHQKASFFMTVWGFRNYHAEGEAYFEQVMKERTVPLLLAVEPQTNASLLAVMQGTVNERLFHKDDIAALRESYRKVWGPVYVAGTQVQPGEAQIWNVRVPGRYKAQGSLRIDGKALSDGDIVDLPRGPVTLEVETAAGLIWADIAAMPKARPPERPYWRGF